MNLNWLKIIFLLLMAIITFVAGVLPVRLLKFLRRNAATAGSTAKHRRLSLIVCLLTCFSGGVFFATCFLHLLPELSEHLEAISQEYQLHMSYPSAELLSCLGFFLLFFIEEAFLLFLPGLANMHSHAHMESSEDSALSGCRGKGEETMMDEKVINSRGESETWTTLTFLEVDDEPKQSGYLCCRQSSYALKGVCPPSENTAAEHDTAGKGLSGTQGFAEPEACESNCEYVDEHPPILMKSRPHAHIHGIRSVTFVLAISFHALIEGLALGVQESASKVTSLFISLMVHKIIVSFSVGLQLGRTHAHALAWVGASIFLFAIMSPLGAVIGMFVHDSYECQTKGFVIAIFQGLSVGFFIYVTFFEVLLHERDNEHPNLLKLLFMLIGFALIGGLRLIDGHGLQQAQHAHPEHSFPNHTTMQSLNDTYLLLEAV